MVSLSTASLEGIEGGYLSSLKVIIMSFPLYCALFKMAQNSFQHLNFDGLFTSTLNHLMLPHQKTAQPLVNMFLPFSYDNRLL